MFVLAHVYEACIICCWELHAVVFTSQYMGDTIVILVNVVTDVMFVI